MARGEISSRSLTAVIEKHRGPAFAGGQGGCSEFALRRDSNFSPTWFWGGTVRQWSRSLAFHRFGDLRSFAFEENADYTCMIHWARNGANRQKLAIESSALARKVQRSVRRVPTILNRTHARAPFGFGVRRMGYVNSVRLTCADSEQVTSNA